MASIMAQAGRPAPATIRARPRPGFGQQRGRIIHAALQTARSSVSLRGRGTAVLPFNDWPMSILHLARRSIARPPAWLRIALVSLMLAFAVDSIAHVVHQHDATVKTLGAHGPACGYCAAFDGLIDAPKQSYSAVTAMAVSRYVAPVAHVAVSFRPIVTAQPRAPPR